MLFIILLLFALAVTVSHAHALRFAQGMTGAPHEERIRLWRKHERWNGLLWVLLFLFVVIVEFLFIPSRITPRPFIGIPFLSVGVLLVIWSRLILGRNGAMGIRWFLPERASVWEKRGPYRVLANPMYDGFIFIFLGVGMWFGTTENFYLALVSFFLLNLYLARVESYELSYHVI